MYYAVHNNGQIIKTGFCSDPGQIAFQVVPDGCELVTSPELVDDFQHQIVGGAVVDRPLLAAPDKSTIVSDDLDAATFAVPIGTLVRVDGKPCGEVLDGTLEFATPWPGVFRIELEPPFPYQSASFTVIANAPVEI
jgi:hypothetical protein